MQEVEHGALMAAHKERLDKLEASRAAEIFTLTVSECLEVPTFFRRCIHYSRGVVSFSRRRCDTAS